MIDYLVVPLSLGALDCLPRTALSGDDVAE
jgi:hypothetical protein